MNRKVSLGLLFFILLLIIFDAVQQKYYVETFDLLPDGEQLQLTSLLRQHFLRWMAWGVFNIPIGFFLGKKLFKKQFIISSQTFFLLGCFILFNIAASLSIISLISMAEQDLAFTLCLFGEFLTFFTFQKGLTFLMASVTFCLILYNQSKKQTIESQLIEIKSLEKKSSKLEEALDLNASEEPHLNIKTGNRIQPISLNEIVWIQSDDYCVKIHTEDQAFTLRKSMKALEELLASYGFIRVHRMALLNLNFLHQINFDSSTIKLSNTTELPLSKKGAKALKQKLKQSAI